MYRPGLRSSMIALLAFGVGPVVPPDSAASERPNIIFIFIDDLGYGDLSIYRRPDDPGPETTHLDQLAREGVRFTQFYVNSPICSPSRVAVTTGQYPQRWNVYGHFASRKRNAERGMPDWLPKEAVTLARLLRQAGYATAHYGKWHMGGQRDVGDAPRPQEYGFDDALVSMEGLGERLLAGGGLGSRQLGPPEEITDVPKHQMTARWVDRAIAFMRSHRQQPVYINLWPRDVHDPFRPSEEQLARIERPEQLPNANQWRRFFAVLKELDRQLGRFVKAVDEMGLGNQTLILVTGDNGPTAWERYYVGKKGPGAAPGFTAGLRGRKWSLYEGGIREPLIVRWLGHTRGGMVNEKTVLCGVDLLPTLCAIAGVDLPPEYCSDGKNLSGALLGQSRPARGRPVFWEYNTLGGNIRPGLRKDRSPGLAMRDGDWKILLEADGTGAELYNLATDRQESENVAGRYPRRARRMAGQLLRWYQSLPDPVGDLKRPKAQKQIR